MDRCEPHRTAHAPRGLAVGLALLGSIAMAGADPRALDGRVIWPAGLERTGQQLPETVIDSPERARYAVRAEAGPDMPLPYYRLTADSYLLLGNIATLDTDNRGWNGNAGFVVTEAGVVVIDALGTPLLGRRLIATIRSVTDRPIRYLIVTHNHPDHAYGAAAIAALDGVQVIAHAGTQEYLGSERMQASVAYRREVLGSDMQGFAPVEPDIAVEGEPFSRYTLNLGGRRFDIYNAGRHHSYGDLVVHDVANDIVWISDLAFNQRTTYMGDGHSRQAVQAQNWLLERFADARLMVPGHGAPQTAPFPMVLRTREYVQRLRETMRAAVKDFVPLQEAVDAAELPDWREVPLYEENHRRNAHFVYREIEAAWFE